MTDNGKNQACMSITKLAREIRQLTVDIRRTLTEEEMILQQLIDGGYDAWVTLRNCSLNGSRYPPLYIYFHVEKDHRESRKVNQSAITTAKCNSDSSMKISSTTNGDVAVDDIADDNCYSTKTFNGSRHDKENSLSFAEYTEMEPCLKISCIRSLLLRNDGCLGGRPSVVRRTEDAESKYFGGEESSV
jgi:hypothetical protein